MPLDPEDPILAGDRYVCDLDPKRLIRVLSATQGLIEYDVVRQGGPGDTLRLADTPDSFRARFSVVGGRL